MPPHEWLSMYEADLATKKWPGGPTCVFLSTWIQPSLLTPRESVGRVASQRNLICFGSPRDGD